jgi:hypothetical protein
MGGGDRGDAGDGGVNPVIIGQFRDFRFKRHDERRVCLDDMAAEGTWQRIVLTGSTWRGTWRLNGIARGGCFWGHAGH